MAKTLCRYPKVDGKITELYGTRTKYASVLGISTNSLCNKLNGKTPWKEREIASSCKLLNIPKEEISIYFSL